MCQPVMGSAVYFRGLMEKVETRCTSLKINWATFQKEAIEK
jgi:hypothetical protein